MPGFFIRRRKQFKAWWHAPVSRSDRMQGAIIGGIGGFWIGVLGRLILGTTPVELSVIAWWGGGLALAGVALGIIFPKATKCVCLPFALIGIGS